MEDIENKIQELTKVELSNFFKNIGAIFFFVSSVATFILSFISGLIFFVLLFFILLFLGSFLKFLLTGYGDISTTYNFFGYLFFPCIFIAEVYGFKLFIKIGKKLNILESIRNDSIHLYKTYKKTLKKQEGIEEILILLEEIQTRLYSIKKLLWFRFLFSEEGKQKLKNLLSLVTSIVLETIKDLKENLAGNIESTKKESLIALTELQFNLYNKNGMREVTDLQSERLNTQIQKFEALQKILVTI